MPKLNDQHKVFLIKRYAGFDTDSIVLAAELADSDVAERHGFKPLVITDRGVRKFFAAKPNHSALTAARQAYLTELQDIPIFNSAYRMRKLQREFSSLEDAVGTPRNKSGYMTGGEIRLLRLKILSEAHKQSGEDVAKIAAGLAASGGNNATTIYNFGGLPDGDKQLIRDNVAAGYANRG